MLTVEARATGRRRPLAPDGLVLAAAIDAGGATGQEVLDVLLASADGEEEIGGMGRHVTTALLGCGRRDAWEAVVRLLLAAQRQEGSSRPRSSSSASAGSASGIRSRSPTSPHACSAR
jgi:hypothetical protein